MDLEVVAISFIFSYLGYLLYENYKNKKALKKIPIIIHVNGTRGKSAVCRLIDAGLRNCGMRVFTKTTGTLPVCIDTKAVEHRVIRFGRTTIREQLKIIQRAAKENPDVLILECMAIDPRLQEILQDKIVKASITVITNVRRDHLKEMGPELINVAKSLGKTTPKNGVLILGEDKFKDEFEKLCHEKNSHLKIAKKLFEKIEIDFPENIGVALEVCEYIKLDREKFIYGMKNNYIEDFGKFKIFKIKIGQKNLMVADGLAANDIDSIGKIFEVLKEKNENITILINNRRDRMERGLEMVQWTQKYKIKKVILTGENLSLLKRKMLGDFKQVIIENELNKIMNHLDSGEMLFMIGNIKGNGERIINMLRREGERIG
jgi:poly-gamma-glutamate synthase PgsB/CapB